MHIITNIEPVTKSVVAELEIAKENYHKINANISQNLGWLSTLCKSLGATINTLSTEYVKRIDEANQEFQANTKMLAAKLSSMQLIYNKDMEKVVANCNGMLQTQGSKLKALEKELKSSKSIQLELENSYSKLREDFMSNFNGNSGIVNTQK